MSTQHSRLRRRLTAFAAAGALGAGVLAATVPAAQAAPATTTGSGPTTVTDASLVWGLSGYAQKGIFGPWRFVDLTGDATYLEGNVGTPVNPTPQTEYLVDPVPATSFPTDKAGKSPNAVKLTDGVGTIDKATGAGKLSWDASYTVNAYPATFNAPNEVYNDPVLTVAADGSGTLTAEFTVGAGVGQDGTAVPAESFGRLKVATFDAGSLTSKTDTGYRVDLDYRGVSNGLTSQTTTCSTADGATGWWGSYPQQFIDALAGSQAGGSVLPHFYSTGCGGMQDNKPPLPLDVRFTTAAAPSVTVSEVALSTDGSADVTVTGTNFDPSLAEATRAPICTAGPPAPCGKPGGTYIAFGKFAADWRPSKGVSSSARKTIPSDATSVKWAVPQASLAGIGGPGAGGVVLSPEGGFTATLTIDKSALDAVATASNLVNYGIYTYPGSGAVSAAYETYTPLTFSAPGPDATTTSVSGVAASSAYGAKRTASVTVAGPDSGDVPTGDVTAKVGTKTVGTGTLDSSGVASVALSRTLDVGTNTVVYTYAGDAAFASSSTSTSVKVTKAAVKISRGSTTKPTTKKTGRTTVRVRSTISGGPAVTGQVLVTFKKSGKTTKQKTKTLSSGTGVVTVPTLAKGTWKVSVKYLGSTRYARTATVSSGSFTVTK